MRLASGVAVAVVVVVGVGLALAVQQRPPQAVTSPSPTVAPVTPSPTPSPTASPTPSPTVAPTRTRTERPRPTTNVAGQQLMIYYFQIRAQFPIFPPTPQIDLDEPAGTDGDAWYRGVTPTGLPIFAVREDYVMTPSTAFHELGHAYQDLLQRRLAGTDVMAKYWSHRGFPATWQDALKDANAKPSGMAQWIQLPGESWAEAFSVAMVGGGREKTLDYGRTINPPAMKTFFISLLPAAP